MMKHLKIAGAMMALGALVACGDRMTVEPGYVAKLNTSSGLKENIIYPSKFRINQGYCVVCDSMILLEASDRRVREELQIFMPRDQLNITLEIVAVIAIETKPEVVDPIFARIPSEATNDRKVSLISFDKVYLTYGRQTIQETVRSVLVKYSINQLMENREAVAVEINQAIVERLKGTPLKVLRVGFGDIQFPDIIVRAKERAAEREAAIAEAENRKAVALKEQEIQLIEAETQMLVDQKLAAGVSKAFMAQRWLSIWEKLAQNDSKTIIVVTPEGMGDPAIMAPTLNRAIAGNTGN